MQKRKTESDLSGASLQFSKFQEVGESRRAGHTQRDRDREIGRKMDRQIDD